MRALLRPLLLVLLLVPAASAQGPALPEDCLAVVTVRQPIAVLARIEQFLQELDLEWAELESLRVLEDPSLELAKGPLRLGVAAPSGRLEDLYPFAMTPTPVEQFVALLNGELTGDIGIVSIGGFEVAARRVHGATYIVPLNWQALLDPSAPAGSQPEATKHDLELAVSERGIEVLRERVAQRRAQQGPRTRVALNQIGWPPSSRWLDAAIAGNAPLADKVGELFRGLSLGVTLGKDGGLSATLTGQLKSSSLQATKTSLVTLPKVERRPMVSLTGDGADGSLHTLVSLLVAYSEGRPDEVELEQYPPDAYAKVAQEALSAFAQVQSIDAVLLSRLPGDPFHSNRVALVRVGDQQEFLDALGESSRLWNQLIEESRAPFQLKVTADQTQLTPGAAPAARFTTDVAAAIDSPPSPEVQAIMRRYYGADGRHVLLAQPVGDDFVLVGDLSRSEMLTILETTPATSPRPSPPLAGVWDVGAYAAWHNDILVDYMADAIGFKRPPELGTALVKFSLSQRDGRWSASASAPAPSVSTLGRFLFEQAQRKAQ